MYVLFPFLSVFMVPSTDAFLLLKPNWPVILSIWLPTSLKKQYSNNFCTNKSSLKKWGMGCDRNFMICEPVSSIYETDTEWLKTYQAIWESSE